MPSSPNESSHKRKRLDAELRGLAMSEGFCAAAKSRSSLPEELLDLGTFDGDGPKRRGKTSSQRDTRLRSKHSSGSLSNGRIRGGDQQAETSSSPARSSTTMRSDPNGAGTSSRQHVPQEVSQDRILFVTSADPRAQARATPKTKSKATSGGGTAARLNTRRSDGVGSKGTMKSSKGKNKDVDKEVETPTRPRTFRTSTAESTGPSLPSTSALRGKQRPPLDSSPTKKVSFDFGASVVQLGLGPLPNYGVDSDEDELALKAVEPQQEDGGDESMDEDQEGIDEEDADGEASDQSDQVSPSKRSATKSGRKKTPNEPVLHVPGFITQSAFDVYLQQISIRARTSSHAFTTLLPTLSLQEYLELLESSPAHLKHATELARLRDSHVAQFPRYLTELQAGFNLLFYGFGSKREILNQFARESCARRGDVVILNAYRPGVGIKELLNRVENLRGEVDATITSFAQATISTTSSAALTALDLQAHRIYQHYSSSASNPSSRPLFIVIHNIDSATLRNVKAKSILGLLASHPRIHLIGSVDHMNAPLIWTQSEAVGRGHTLPLKRGSANGQDDGDHPMDSGDDDAIPTSRDSSSSSIPAERNFTWLWHDLTTFEHYDVELRAQGRDLTSVTVLGSSKSKLGALDAGLGWSGGGPAGTAGPLTEAGARQVLSSVTERSRKVFDLLASKMLASIDEEADEAIRAAATSDGSPVKKANVTAAQMNRYAIPYETLFRAAREGFIVTSDQALRGLLQEFKDHGMIVTGSTGVGGAEMIWIPVARIILERLTSNDDE